ncbi:MAG: hypothetical protein JSV62_06265 [Promethearchaeota archaeon]|nr:MAG: hypothetical protein JSV62_06265 [Candidatus Lokiarchaeota archaeon]
MSIGKIYTSFFFIEICDDFIVMWLKNEKNPNNYFNMSKDGKYYVFCSECNQIAATIDIENLGYTGTLEKSLDSKSLEILVELLQTKDISELDMKLKNDKIMNFGIDIYCGECGKVYCKKHWKTRAIFEDSGWYDYTKSTCPKGHSKMIDD